MKRIQRGSREIVERQLTLTDWRRAVPGAVLGAGQRARAREVEAEVAAVVHRVVEAEVRLHRQQGPVADGGRSATPHRCTHSVSDGIQLRMLNPPQSQQSVHRSFQCMKYSCAWDWRNGILNYQIQRKLMCIDLFLFLFIYIYINLQFSVIDQKKMH